VQYADSHGQQVALFSDDTQMAIIVADSDAFPATTAALADPG
jgi:hypothetical protein